MQTFPISPQRIVHVRHFPAGRWYPFVSIDTGCITDAKTCGVVGTVLLQDLCNGNLIGFSVAKESADRICRTYCWGVINPGGMAKSFFESANLLFRPSDYPHPAPGNDSLSFDKEFELPLNCRVGRQIVHMPTITPEPVYELKWTPAGVSTPGEVKALVKLRWISVQGEGERLELVDVRNAPDFSDVNLERVSMQLNTMMDESFWLDDPRLEVGNLPTS